MFRDTRADANYFDRQRDNLSFGVESSVADLSDPERALSDPQGYIFDASLTFRYSLGLVGVEYSTGAHVDTVTPRVVETVDSFVFYQDVERAYRAAVVGTVAEDYTATRHSYVDTLHALSLAIAFDLGDESIRRVLGAIGAVGADALVDTIGSYFRPGQPVGEKPAYARPYAHLLKVIRAEENKRPALMAAFLDAWYPGNRGVRWFEGDLRIAKGGLFYTGFWCFEAAAIVTLLGIDDSSFRDNPYYPADLVRR